MILWTLMLALQAGEVRQLVTFHFLPGRTAEAIGIFRDQALPLYRANEPMLRFRAYREAESPEPLDLVVVSSFRGMAGMDASNLALAEEAKKRGGSVGEIYGRIADASSGHRDEFVEMDPSLSWGDVDGSRLVVFVRVRLSPGRSANYEKLLRDRLVPWEKETKIVSGSESGRFLLGDGFSFFRILGIGNLEAWQRYVSSSRQEAFARNLDEWTAASKQVILAPLPELRVR